jgi:NADH dehydrogenase FAD-containing subunit
MRMVPKIAANDESMATMPYDLLVVSVGAFSNTFGVPGVKENCLFLKSVEGFFFGLVKN